MASRKMIESELNELKQTAIAKGYMVWTLNAGSGFLVSDSTYIMAHKTDRLDSDLIRTRCPINVLLSIRNERSLLSEYRQALNDLKPTELIQNVQVKIGSWINVHLRETTSDRYDKGLAQRKNSRYGVREIRSGSMGLQEAADWYLNGLGNTENSQRCRKGNTQDYYKNILVLTNGISNFREWLEKVQKRQKPTA